MNFSYWVAYVVYRRQKKGLATMLNHMAWMNVAFGLAAVLVAFFVLRGFRQEVSDKLHAYMGHVQVRPYILVDAASRGTIDLRYGLYKAYQGDSLQNVAFIQPHALQAALLKTKRRALGVQFKGVALPYEAAGGLPDLQAGRMVDFGAAGYAKECVLSTKIAEELSLSIGDTLVIHFLKQPPQYRKLRVVGLYRTALEELDARLVVGDLRLLQHLHGWQATQAGGLELFMHSSADMDAQVRDIFDHVAYGLQVTSMAEDYPQLFDWFSMLDKNTYIFLGLIAAVAGFNMLALCMILIMERQAMIGTLQALGATRGWIQQLFFCHSFIWVLWGMLCGNILAFGLAFVQTRYHVLTLDAENYAMDYVPIYIEWPLWLGANIVFLLWLCMALGLALRGIVRTRLLVSLNAR